MPRMTAKEAVEKLREYYYPGDTAPEIDPEEYGWIHHDEERCTCGQFTKDGGLCPECLQVQAEHMADVKENR